MASVVTAVRLPGETLTPFLGTCKCTRCSEPGALCSACGCHGEVTSHAQRPGGPVVCDVDGCGVVGPLLCCGGCNLAHHRECMGTVRWGQNKDLTDLPFCEDCFEEFTDAGTAQENAASRGDTTVAYDAPNRAEGPALAAVPVPAHVQGQKRKRLTRAGGRALRDVAMVACATRRVQAGTLFLPLLLRHPTYLPLSPPPFVPTVPAVQRSHRRRETDAQGPLRRA
jgi:hypothetical protein